MSEEKYPKVVVGAFIFNDKDELLMVKAPNWKNKFTNVGGHVEMNESLEHAITREIKEETNLEIHDLEQLKVIDGLGLGKYNSKEMEHRIFID